MTRLTAAPAAVSRSCVDRQTVIRKFGCTRARKAPFRGAGNGTLSKSKIVQTTRELGWPDRCAVRLRCLFGCPVSADGPRAVHRRPKNQSVSPQKSGHAIRPESSALAAQPGFPYPSPMLDVTPKVPEDALVAARTLLMQGDLDASLCIYKGLLERALFDHEVLHNIGIIALRKGDPQTAVEWMRRSLCVTPANATYIANTSLVHGELGHATTAEALLRRAVLLMPSNAGVLERFLLCLRARDATDQTIRVHRALITLQPDSPESHEQFARSLLELSRPQAAAELLRRALRLQPDSDPTRTALAGALRALDRCDEAMDVLKQCRDQTGHDWLAQALKTSVRAGWTAQAAEAGQRLLLRKEAIAHHAVTPQQRQAAVSGWPTKPKPFDPNRPERNVIAFSLWGSNEKYTLGAVLNAKLAKIYYPGWTARFYCDASVPESILKALRNYGAQVVQMEAGGRKNFGLFWRFFASNDPNIDRFLCRDCDSALNRRESAAVEEWVASDHLFHIMRDHLEHAELIMAGMWGGVAGLLPNMNDGADTYYAAHESRWRWIDQDFLRDCVWALISNHCLAHDTHYTMARETRRFPAWATLAAGDHVGSCRIGAWQRVPGTA